MFSRKSDKPHSFNVNNQVYRYAGQAQASQSLYYLESCRIFRILHLFRLNKHQHASSNTVYHQQFYFVVQFFFSKKEFH